MNLLKSLLAITLAGLICDLATANEPCGPSCQPCVKVKKSCYGEPEVKKVKKTCYDVEYKDICIPRCRCPFFKKCCRPLCGRVRTVKVLRKRSYDVEKCGVKWTIEAHCQECCDEACIEGCGTEPELIEAPKGK